MVYMSKNIERNPDTIDNGKVSRSHTPKLIMKGGKVPRSELPSLQIQPSESDTPPPLKEESE